MNVFYPHTYLYIRIIYHYLNSTFNCTLFSFSFGRTLVCINMAMRMFGLYGVASNLILHSNFHHRMIYASFASYSHVHINHSYTSFCCIAAKWSLVPCGALQMESMEMNGHGHSCPVLVPH